MNKKELIQNLITDIQDIYSISNRLEHTEQIHPLDIDLALSKVRNLYDLLLKLNSQGSYITENQKEEISTIPKQSKEDIKPDISKETVKEEIRPEIKKDEPKNPEIHEPEFIIEKTEEKEERIEQGQTEKKEKKSSKSSPEIVADKFQSKKFVHDDIAKKNIKKDVSTKMQSKPINDINSAIGLNDKFIFIRELFGNNKDQYHETIQILNNFDTYENAVDFLNENFNWDPEDINFDRLKELVRRKYSTK